jgi:hypothetical protein
MMQPAGMQNLLQNSLYGGLHKNNINLIKFIYICFFLECLYRFSKVDTAAHGAASPNTLNSLVDNHGHE